MNRRKWLALSGTVLLSKNSACIRNSDQMTDKQVKDVLEKVTRAMLSMQRASWEQGVAAQSFLEYGADDQVYLMAKEAVLRQTEEGRLSVLYTDNGITDPAASGEAVLYAAQKWGDKDLQSGAEAMLRYLMEKAPRTKEGVLSHTLNEKQIWIDSMYMAPPFLAVAGQPEEAVHQIRGIDQVLYHPEKKLYAHIWNAEKGEFINPAFWGVGNGWALAGMVRVYNALPESMKRDREWLIQRIQTVLDSCLSHIRSDYLFHNIIDDLTTFTETNLSQMIAYTIFRGISGKWLDSHYLDVAVRIREAVFQKVDVHGFVQDVCGAPFFNAPGRATEGQAFFILMEAAYQTCCLETD